MLLLDTQALLWSRLGDRRLGNEARRLIEEAILQENAAVSTFTFWEIAMLHSKGRVDLPSDIRTWRHRLLTEGLQEIPVSSEIAIRANELTDLHSDPADRIIVATALEGHQLMTSDARILGWMGELERVNAQT